MIKLRFNITDGGIEGGQNFYLPQLIPSFFAPFFSHFRRTRITPTKLIRFCARQQLCHTARHNWQSIRGTIPHSRWTIIIGRRRENETIDDREKRGDSRWNIIRRFFLPGSSSLLSCWNIFGGEGKKIVYTIFWKGEIYGIA